MGLDRNSLLNARLATGSKSAPSAPKPSAPAPKQQQQMIARSPNQIMAQRRQSNPGSMPRRVIAAPTVPAPKVPQRPAAQQPRTAAAQPQPRPTVVMGQPVPASTAVPVPSAPTRDKLFVHVSAVEVPSLLKPAMELADQMSVALSPLWKAQHTATLNSKGFSAGIGAFVNEANQVLGRVSVTIRQLERAQADQRGVVIMAADLAQIEKLSEYIERASKVNVG